MGGRRVGPKSKAGVLDPRAGAVGRSGDKREAPAPSSAFVALSRSRRHPALASALRHRRFPGPAAWGLAGVAHCPPFGLRAFTRPASLLV